MLKILNTNLIGGIFFTKSFETSQSESMGYYAGATWKSNQDHGGEAALVIKDIWTILFVHVNTSCESKQPIFHIAWS